MVPFTRLWQTTECKVHSQDESYWKSVGALCAAMFTSLIQNMDPSELYCRHNIIPPEPNSSASLNSLKCAWNPVKNAMLMKSFAITSVSGSTLSLQTCQFLNSFLVSIWRGHAVPLFLCVFISTVYRIFILQFADWENWLTQAFNTAVNIP